MTIFKKYSAENLNFNSIKAVLRYFLHSFYLLISFENMKIAVLNLSQGLKEW